MIDTILHLAFNVTGSRRISDIIGARRATRRWNAMLAEHKAAGGDIVTIERPGRGTETILVPAGALVHVEA